MNGKRWTVNSVFLAGLVSWQFNILTLAAVAVLCAEPTRAAEEPGVLHEQQLMRQQQQDALRLRMQQQHRSLQSPPSGAQERQAREQLQIEQRQRQEQLHYRQEIRPSATHAGDDEGVQRAKAQMQQRRAKEEGEQQLQRFNTELEEGAEDAGAAKARGEVRSPEPAPPLQ